MNCFDYKIGEDSAGSPIMARQCHCGTTICKTLSENDFSNSLKEDEDVKIARLISKANYGNIL